MFFNSLILTILILIRSHPNSQNSPKEQKYSKSTVEILDQVISSGQDQNNSRDKINGKFSGEGNHKSKSEKSTQVTCQILINDVGLNSDSPYRQKITAMDAIGSRNRLIEREITNSLN